MSKLPETSTGQLRAVDHPRLVRPLDLSDERIGKLFVGTNFGPAGKTPLGRRGLMVECVLKQASGYADGSTINAICIQAGFLGARFQPTKNGMRWAFGQIYNSGDNLMERLYRTNEIALTRAQLKSQ